MSGSAIEMPQSLHHSHQYQQMDLGDTILLYAGEGPGGQMAVGEIYNFDDLPHLADKDCEDFEMVAEAIADKVVRAYNLHDDLLGALNALFSNPHIDLGDLVYQVREREGKGWDGPAVKAWSDAVMAAKAAIEEAKPKGEPDANPL